MGKANRNRINKKKDGKKPDGNESKTTEESSSKGAEAKADGKKVEKVSQISSEGAQAAAHSPLGAAKEGRSTDTTKEQNSDPEDLDISDELLKLVEGIGGSGVINEHNEELKAKFERGEISVSEYESRLHSIVADNLESNEYYKSEFPKFQETLDKAKIFKAERLKLQKFANTLSSQKSKANIRLTLRKLSEELVNYENKIAAVKLSAFNKLFGMTQDRLGNARRIDGAASGDDALKETSTSQTLTEGIQDQKYENESTDLTEYIKQTGKSAQSEREDRNEEKRSKKDTDIQDIQLQSKMEELSQEFEDFCVQEKNISEASHSNENDEPKSLKKAKKDRGEFQRDMKKFMEKHIFRLRKQKTEEETSTSQILIEEIKGQKDGNESTGSTEGIQTAEQSAQNESEDKNEEKKSKKETGDQDIQFKSKMEKLSQESEDFWVQEKNISEASHSSENNVPKSLKKSKKDRDEFQRDMKKFMENQISRLSKQKTQEETSTSQILIEEIKGQKDGNETTGSTEGIQTAEQSAQNESEDKNEEKKSKKETDDQDIQFKSQMEELAQKFKDCKIQEKNISEASHSSEKDKPKSLKKTKKDVDEFQSDMKKFMANQMLSLNKQATHGDREEALKAMKKQWDEEAVGFSEETASAAEKTETFEERKDSEEEIRNLITEEIEEVSKNAEVDDEPKEKIIQMKKDDYIHFEYDNDSDRHIFTSERYYFNTVQDDRRILFCFNDETIQVLFTTDRVFVSTPNSEFSFLIRRYGPVDSTEKATQTDINQ